MHKASKKETTTTIYFISKQLSQTIQLPNAIIINVFIMFKNPMLRKFSEFIWLISLRIKRITIWYKYFYDAEIFAQDHFIFSSILIANQPYTFISDGFNDFNAYMRTEIFKKTYEWRTKNTLKHYFIKLLCGQSWNGWFCFNDNCNGPPWTAARQASLSIANSRSLLKLMSIRSVMPSNHLIFCRPFSSHLQAFSTSGSFPMS